MSNPTWRTKKVGHAENLRQEIERINKRIREMEIEAANLKQILAEIETSELPILLYGCCRKDDDSGRLDYNYLYYLPDLQTTKLDHIVRYLNIKDENHLRPNTLDLRSTFKNCGFPDAITSSAPGFWSLGQSNQHKVDKASSSLKSVIDHLFNYEEIESWDHLRKRLTAYYFPAKPQKPIATRTTEKPKTKSSSKKTTKRGKRNDRH